MTIAYVGKIPLSVAMPLSVTAVADAAASLALALPPIAVNLTAAFDCSISLGLSPPNLAAAIAVCVQLLVELNLGLTLSLPMLDFQATALIKLIAEITPIIASISASLLVTLPFAELLGTAGIQAFSFAGTGEEFGNLVNQELANGTPDGQTAESECLAFVLASTASGTWTGMQTFFTLIPPSQPAHSVEYVGGVSLGALCGDLGQGILDANLNLNLQLGQLSAQLQGALAMQASFTPPTFASNISLVGQIKSSLQAYLSLGGFVLPTAAITAIGNIVTELGDLVTKLNANISALAAITASLSTSGVLCYSYNGTIAGLGPALTTEVGSGWNDGTSATAPSNALILVGSAGVTSSLMSTFFGGL